MLPLTMLGTDLAILIVNTTRVWWRLLPKILVVYLLGWLGYRVSLELAVLTGDISAWLSLAIFSTGFIFKLAAIVIILRLAGAELKVRDLIPEDEYEDDGRESSVTRLLSLTLLPFLGIYTAFGQIQEAAADLQVQSKFQSGGVLSQTDITGRLNLDSGTPRHYLIVTAVVVGAYIARRLIDKVYEETGWRPLGFVVALIEGFFVLSVLIAGGGAVQRVLGWLGDRVFASWLDAIGAALHSAWTHLTALLPGFVITAVTAIKDGFWPVLTEVVTQPIIWLAVAALIYGSSVISVAELWRQGKPLASRVRVARRRIERQSERPRRDFRPDGRVAFVGAELKEAFLGDIDDKYLPTIHSLRLILRAGLVFLGAYVLVYNLLEILSNYWIQVTNHLIGGHPIAFWSAFGPEIDLLQNLPIEPWRICLLAVALQRALQIFRSRAARTGRLHPQDEGERSATSVAASELEPAGVSGRDAS